MPRPKSGREPKAYYRRTPNWCPELTALAQEAAQLIRTKQIFFPRSLDFGGQANIAGIVQGVLIAAAQAAKPPEGDSSITPEEWGLYISRYRQMKFKPGVVKGLYFDDESLAAFDVLGKVLEKQDFPDDIKLKWGTGYRLHVVMAIALEWFTSHYRNS